MTRAGLVRRCAAVLVVAVVVCGLLLPATAVADTRTARHIHLELLPQPLSLIKGYFYTRPAKVDVYGPGGYYQHWEKSYWMGALSNPKTVFASNSKFTQCPTGSYRIRCRWYNQKTGALIREDNKYITVSANSTWVGFRSPW